VPSARRGSLGQPAYERPDQRGHVVLGQPEGSGTGVVTPQREDDELSFVGPGQPERAGLVAGIEKHVTANR
jgi:hypothetical protein